MKIGFFLSTLGGSPLVVGLERGLRALGHHVEAYRHGHGYELVLVVNQTAHVTSYVYPEFPPANIPIAFIDSAEFGVWSRLPDRVHRFANTFAEGAMNHDTKNLHEQTRLRMFLEGRSFPYFIREYSKFLDYPEHYHCIDYPSYASSECHEVPNREEYLRRDLDLFVSWGASHPWRLPITEALRGCHTKCEIHVLGENGTPRMHQPTYLAKTRSAKCSVSSSGYGSSSFRLHEVLGRCLLLQGPLEIKMREPLIDGVHCVEFQIESEGENFLSTNICQKLRESLADPDRSFTIYETGYWHCRNKLSETAAAAYVLDVVSKHDWRTPTKLDIDPAVKIG